MIFGTSPSQREAPKGPVGAYKTYRIAAPPGSHWRSASCAEVDCDAYLNGWVTILAGTDERIPLLRRSGRRFFEYRDTLPDHVVARLPDADPAHTGPRGLGPGLIAFYFEPGQRCFQAATHRLRIGRPELFVVRDGDWRGNPTGQRRVHRRAEDWVEDFALHQDHVKTEVERG